MPEGPSIVLLKEEVKKFTGKKVISVHGNSKIEQSRLVNKKVISFESWGKHFLICFKEFTVRVHFLMWGTYLVNQQKEQPVRLNITFKTGELNLYSCSIKLLEGDVNTHYDWSADVMNNLWNPENARIKLKAVPDKLICDALLEQDIFSGVGNIIKNEILYRVCVHPESSVGKLPARIIKKLVAEARTYSFEFLEWKRNHELKKHWLVNTKKMCPRCNSPIVKKYTGVKNRRSFFCVNCQQLYI
jgi:endonuclease-8